MSYQRISTVRLHFWNSFVKWIKRHKTTAILINLNFMYLSFRRDLERFGQDSKIVPRLPRPLTPPLASLLLPASCILDYMTNNDHPGTKSIWASQANYTYNCRPRPRGRSTSCWQCATCCIIANTFNMQPNMFTIVFPWTPSLAVKRCKAYHQTVRKVRGILKFPGGCQFLGMLAKRIISWSQIQCTKNA